jgi:hypothetical protein
VLKSGTFEEHKRTERNERQIEFLKYLLYQTLKQDIGEGDKYFMVTGV